MICMSFEGIAKIGQLLDDEFKLAQERSFVSGGNSLLAVVKDRSETVVTPRQ